MSLAPTSRRGLALNCRLAVNGIQKASRLLGEASKDAVSTTLDMPGVLSGGPKTAIYIMLKKLNKIKPVEG